MKKGNSLHVGIDVGSTTVKAVVVDADHSTLWKDYRRHNTKQPETVRDFLATIQSRFPDRDLSLFITGSGGRAIAPSIGARYIQEVNAVTYAVESLHPETGSVIELGGQDAKVIIWKTDEQGRKGTITFMNEKCAGGTGATIDKIFGKIGISIEDANRITISGRTIHHIAAKCGVFAETDVVGLVKAGVDREEVFLSLCAAVVKQNLEVLVHGNVLRDKVLLLGGPNYFIPAFTDLWRSSIPETWELHRWEPRSRNLEETILVPEDGHYFAALGSVLYGRETEELNVKISHADHLESHFFKGLDSLDHYIREGRLAQLESYGATRDGLVTSEEEVESFRRDYAIPDFTPPELEAGGASRCYIGIDGGSTSSKLVVTDEKSEPLYKDYLLSKGNPIIDVREMFDRMNEWQKAKGIRLEVLGTAVTGYASEILKKAFQLDVAVVETVAHMRSAVKLYGSVDVICDVGGQDIKVLFLRHGRVVDFKLNTQCSAGNGFFLQGMAEQFGVPVSDYASCAFRARKAPAFNYGCAVFMEQDKVNFQQLGWTKDEIMAGLALVLPLNIWNYVVQETNIARFGLTFVLQGGTQKNLAAAKAQVDFIKSKVPSARVIIHRYADISGAIGAAMEAREAMKDRASAFIGVEASSRVKFTATNNEATRCTYCQNRCSRTFLDIEISAGKMVRSISGNGCENGASEDVDGIRHRQKDKIEHNKRCPNLVQEAARLVFENFPFEELPAAGKRWSPFTERKKEKPRRRFTRPFERSGSESARRRAAMCVGIPRLLNLYYYAPFFSTYLRCLGVGKLVYSHYTSARLWEAGNKFGAIDPCFPAKVAPAHIYDLLRRGGCSHILFPRITHLESPVQNTLANTACVIQMGTPEVVEAVFTRDRDLFKDHGVTYLKPLVNMDKPLEAEGYLFEYFRDSLGITRDENEWAVEQGYLAMARYLGTLRAKGREVLNGLIDRDSLGLLIIGHPYHHDPGFNHGIADEFQARGFPILCIESLPTDAEFLEPLFGAEDARTTPHDISDVWQRNFNRNTNVKFWAARIASRHPNLAVLDFSSFKCGHDAPTYSYMDQVLDASETPHFLFHDVDQNKPGATIKLRLDTIEYFLHEEEARLRKSIDQMTRDT